MQRIFWRAAARPGLPADGLRLTLFYANIIPVAGIAKWSNASDCKSAGFGLRRFDSYSQHQANSPSISRDFCCRKAKALAFYAIIKPMNKESTANKTSKKRNKVAIIISAFLLWLWFFLFLYPRAKRTAAVLS